MDRYIFFVDKKIYFDLCCLNRPFDDQTQERIHFESEAVLALLEQVQEGRCILVGSQVLDLENGKNPDSKRKNEIEDCLKLAKVYVEVGQQEVDRANELQSFGLKSYDALHLACAESAKADIFFTTDDDIVKKTTHIENINTLVMNPLDGIKVQWQ